MSHRSYWFLVSLLGSLSVISPFAIDTYLPAYPQMAADLGVQTAVIAWTLSGYFIGLALGQIFYGPLLDRFGRKTPLTAGLSMFVLASLACAVAPDVYTLIALRFVQALGGCVAQVASIAMVADFFPVKDKARVLSRLFLFIAASPLLAPSIGSLMMLAGGWRLVFLFLAGGALLILALVRVKLPEGHKPDPSISLRPGPILADYLRILGNARFATYVLAGAFSFAGLFTYVAGSPIIFRDGFGLGETAYSVIFAVLAAGFIGGSQLNVVLLKRADSETLFFRFLLLQVAVGLVFVTATALGVCGLAATIMLLFAFLSCVGVTNPNASAVALSPFTKNAGSASALLGFFQLGVGAVISTGIGAVKSADETQPTDRLPIIAIMAATAVVGLVILLVGRRRVRASTTTEPAAETHAPLALTH